MYHRYLQIKMKHKGTKAQRRRALIHSFVRAFFVSLCLCVSSLEAIAQPRTIEINLEAKIARVTIEPGHELDAWTYNGDIPGPVIRAHIGDYLIVHFTNNLP